MKLTIRGARENNLQNIDVEFKDGLTVVTGVSGSGKSSLIFDTLNQEAQRRFQEMFTLGASCKRIPPAVVDEISGLLPTVAIGQNLLNRNPNSTVASASGLQPLFRLLFTRFGDRHCPQCGTPVKIFDEDALIDALHEIEKPCQVQVPLVRKTPGSHATLLSLLKTVFDPKQIIIDGDDSINPSLNPDTPHTIEVVLAILTGDENVTELRQLLHQASALGSSIVRVKTSGSMETFSTAPICSNCGTWLSALEPKHFHQRCPDCKGEGCTRCQGTGMHPNAAATSWGGARFDQLLAQPISRIQQGFTRDVLPVSAGRLHSEIGSRLDALVRVGLGYVTLDRPAPTLSRGEAQRLRLAVLLTERLSDLLHLLDEPTIGQHPHDIDNLMEAVGALSGPVIYVEHDRIAAACADAALDIGPGAGNQGGKIVFSGTPAELWKSNTSTGLYFSGRESCQLPAKHNAPERFMTIKGANQHNLQEIDIPFALGRLNVVCGVSGSGKSTLVENVLFASLTAGKIVGCEAIEHAVKKVEMVDQSPIGRNPRSNPATYTKLLDFIRDCFAANTGLDATNFSFNTSQGACPICKGMGAVEVKMRYLPSTWITCSECEGARYADEVLDAKVTFIDGIQRSIADLLNLTVSEAMLLMCQAPGLSDRAREKAKALLQALQMIGLGYLTLGQPSPTLSGGEAQRVKLAKYLGRQNLKDRLLILDEPSTGLHPADLHGLLLFLDRLVDSGGTVVMVEHNLDIIRAADWLIELGPGAGPAGGQLLFAGPLAELGKTSASPTSQALAEEADLVLHPIRTETQKGKGKVIGVSGARVNNLQNIDIDIPKNVLTVVTGVSGSGKSSLVKDVIEREAQRRYFESLGMYERQSVHEGREADVDAVTGLGITLSLGTQRAGYDLRAHLGDDTEINQGLAVLFAQAGTLACPECSSRMVRERNHFHCHHCEHKVPLPKPRHFNASIYAAACQTCHGVGTLQQPQPEKLIIHPEKPLCDGAMYSPGFFPNGYLCKPFNGGHDMLQAFAGKYNFDPAATPWREMSPEAQHGFLFGDPEPMPVTFISRTGHVTHRVVPFPGFYGFIRDWDRGGTYTLTVPCPECQGAGLRKPYRCVKLGDKTIFELRNIPLRLLQSIIDTLPEDLVENPITANIITAIRTRLRFLCEVGLGYLNLDRYTATLSAGEAQRVKLAGLLDGRLIGLTVLLDEPSRGMHPTEVDAMVQALRKLQDAGNTVIVVEHDLQIIQAADHILDIGPGAGRFGGKIVAQGSTSKVSQADTVTGRWLRHEKKIYIPIDRNASQGMLKLHKPSGYNLKIDTLEIPLGVMVGVCGVSGSGKSTLILDTLGRILAPPKQTTSVAYEPIRPEPYEVLEGAPVHSVVIDQTRAGLHNPASFLGVEPALRKAFAESEMAYSLGLDVQSLKKNCSACGGRGVQRIKMGFLPDIFEICDICGGSGYPDEANAIRLHDHTLPEVMAMSIERAHQIFVGEEKIANPLSAAMRVGLGYLILNQPARTLSGGEAQRLKIAFELNKRIRNQTLYLLDEPTVGQHLEDIQRLIGVLRELVAVGGSVIVVEHHPHVLAACDWLIELGPGGGPDGGMIIASGRPEAVARKDTPTAPYIRQILEERG